MTTEVEVDRTGRLSHFPTHKHGTFIPLSRFSDTSNQYLVLEVLHFICGAIDFDNGKLTQVTVPRIY